MLIFTAPEQIAARDWVYEVRSEHSMSDWFLADRRCFRLVRYYMGRWIRRRTLQTVNTLLCDPVLAEGREANYGTGGVCTELLKVGTAVHKTNPEEGLEPMWEDRDRVGFTMRARTGDMSLPHDRVFEKRWEAEAAVHLPDGSEVRWE